MRKGASVNRHVPHSWKRDVIDVVPSAFDETGILDPRPAVSEATNLR